MQELNKDWFKLGQCWQMQWNSFLVLALPADAGFQVSKKVAVGECIPSDSSTHMIYCM
jgi:hypothetical protein